MFKTKIEEVRMNELCVTENSPIKKQKKTFLNLKKFGYPVKEEYILVSKNNEIIKGNHIYCALKKFKGDVSKIKVKKLQISKDMYIFLYFNFSIMILIFIILILRFI